MFRRNRQTKPQLLVSEKAKNNSNINQKLI